MRRLTFPDALHYAQTLSRVPVPPALLEALDLVHGIRELQGLRWNGRGVRL